jgi:serine/threonine-protein kinase HipA
MMRCPITYEEISSGRYSDRGLRRLNPALTELNPLPYDHQEQLREARRRMEKMSIAGVQPKLSAQLSIKDHEFKIVSKNGSYILKPEWPEYDEVPQNEDLTMRMAASAGIEVPLHGLIYAEDDSMLYFIRRFDRVGKSGKIHVEDFAQVAGLNRQTKYNYSIERLIALIDQYCTFPMVEKLKLFRRILFCWITGNEDMHVKNFSIIHRDNMIALTPAYDLLNTTIVLENPREEMALTLNGKKSNFDRSLFFDYLGSERMGLNQKVLTNTEQKLRNSLPQWFTLIDKSFLTDPKRDAYRAVIHQRISLLGW